MCGFGGVLNSSKLLSHGLLSAAADKVSFRGPDNCGTRIFNDTLKICTEGNVGFFFNRLAILDLDPRSNQPFESDRFLLLFNGEIYNYRELKESLASSGVNFTTTSDTEVLFHGLSVFGKDFLSRINGMFSFFFLDKTERTFLLSRDRLGIKPLYYKQENQSLIFGSELNTILRLSSVDSQISRDAIEMYLWMQTVPSPFSIINGILKLPPGSYISASLDVLDRLNEIKPEVYWDAYSAAASSPYSQSPALETVLTNALERQLHADVPLGLFLSSGVDSSLLVAIVNKHFSNEQDVNLFTVAFDEDTMSDESRDAIKFIDGFNNPGFQNHLLHVDPGYLQDHLQDLYRYFDEPFSDSASLLNWTVSKKAREFVTVALSGDGADELFWGYPRYNRFEVASARNRFPLVSNAVNYFAKLLPDSQFKFRLLTAMQTDPIQRHFDQFLPLGMRFLAKESILRFPMWSLDGVEKILKRPDLPGILDFKTYLADAMLYKVDRSSMAASLEVRVPFLDNEVVDYAMGLPFKEKSNGRFTNKAVLKTLLMKLAPHYEVERSKKGFNFPLRKWLMTNWKDQVMSSVTSDKMISLGLDPAKFLPVMDGFYQKEFAHYEHDVWSLFNLSLWYDEYKRVSKV